MTLYSRKNENDICNINLLYSSNYTYFLPGKTLDLWMRGKAFEHPDEYSLEEQEHLKDDIRDIYEKICSGKKNGHSSLSPQIIMTAGAPGSGKTMLVSQQLSLNGSEKMIYLSSTDLCLTNQLRTYRQDILNSDQSLASRQSIFSKWKPGSVAAKHLILGHMIQDRQSLYLGATCIEPYLLQLLNFLKEHKYQIKLLYVVASDQTRWNSIQERNKIFAHSKSNTEHNVIKQGIDFAKQLPNLLVYVDEISFYYREKVEENAKLVALWTKRISLSENLDNLQILLANEYRKVKLLHNASIAHLLRSDLIWENALELHSKISYC